MVGIVEADRKDLSRTLHGRLQPDGRQGQAAARRGLGLQSGLQHVPFANEVHHGAVLAAVDDAVADNDAGAGLAIGGVGGEFHERFPFGWRRRSRFIRIIRAMTKATRAGGGGILPANIGCGAPH